MTWGMPTTTNPLWNRALASLMPLTGRDLSISVSAADGWLVAIFSGTLDHVEVVSMRGGDGGEDARLHLNDGASGHRIYLSEHDLMTLEGNAELLKFGTCAVIVELAVL